MCGICGKLDFEKGVSASLIEKMKERLVHRGPDGEGTYINFPIGLGHRRLSIIDLSDAGSQPMEDSSGRYVIIHNGEVYNFKELKKELTSLGAGFKSMTDTEVILEAYKHWGVDCLNRFNGMFAFAIWDRVERTLFLARDRMGKKPLFYYRTPFGIVFASELKSLLEDREISFKISHEALNLYLSLNYTPGPLTIIEGVYKLEPASYLIINGNNTLIKREYWDLSDYLSNKTELSFEESALSVKEKLDRAVEKRLISDVPLGAFISGGIDSAAVVASMINSMPGRVNTFSIGFKEKKFCELKEASFAADMLGVDFHSEVVTGDIAEDFSSIIWYNDEPFGDTSLIPMYYLAQIARKYVTVSLSGDGSDELFSGYVTNKADCLYNYYSSLVPLPLRTMFCKFSDSLLPVSFNKVSFDYKLRQFLKGSLYSREQAHYYWRSIFSTDEKRKIYKEEYRYLADNDPFLIFKGIHDKVKHLPFHDQCFYVDIKTWLTDDILVKVDRASMAHSLEVRVPFLDYELVEFAASLPESYKQKRFKGKVILKKAVKGRVPEEVINRKKSGFNAPVSWWLLDSFKDIFQHALSVLVSLDGVLPLNPEEVKRLWIEHQQQKADHHLKLFGILSLILWYDIFRKRLGL